MHHLSAEDAVHHAEDLAMACLDHSQRSQLGAHYTSQDDILLIVEPVLMQPLRRRWDEVQQQAQEIIAKRDAANGAAQTHYQQKLKQLLLAFTDEIAAVRILDPACGSGNFLYVALRCLLDLWKEVSILAENNGLSGFLPDRIGPHQLYGIECDVYAHALALVVIRIGYIQWLHDNGFGIPDSPILKPLHNIQHMDAILTCDGAEPEWPEADVIIGNPPFLGGNKVRRELGDAYVEALFQAYKGRLPAFSDLVCYWFERSRTLIATGKVKRAGLLATNSIRGGANRRVLDRIKQTGDIFFAYSDRPWVLDGAGVRVSMVGFDNGDEQVRNLDEVQVQAINPDLTIGSDLTIAQRLKENANMCFMGPSPKAPFDIGDDVAQKMLMAPTNVNGRPNSDVVRPVTSAVDLVRHSRGKWTIDFGLLSLSQASEYELPFEYVRKHVHPIRSQEKHACYGGNWWQYATPREAMREALKGKLRYIATPAVSRNRIFVWVKPVVLCNQGTLVFARDDDYFFGILHSKVHEMWSLRMGTSLVDGPRYTHTTTFETFPFPWAPGQEPADDERVEAIAQAARALVEKRDAWLNPPGASESDLKKRTLTNLYNQRPTWLERLHLNLDHAVLDAYGWPHDLSDEDILGKLLALNLERAGGGHYVRPA